MDFHVEVPPMPTPESPNMETWVPFLSKVIGKPDTDTILIGHSIGCITILRYLETLEKGERIGGAVLVAGFTDNLGYKEIQNFFQKPIDWDKIKQHCTKFVAIHSTNDPYVKLHHGDIFKEELKAKLIIEQEKGHMGGSDDMKELPSVIESVKELIGLKL